MTLYMTSSESPFGPYGMLIVFDSARMRLRGLVENGLTAFLAQALG